MEAYIDRYESLQRLRDDLLYAQSWGFDHPYAGVCGEDDALNDRIASLNEEIRLATPLECLDALSVRAYNVMKRMGIDTVEQMLAMTVQDLQDFALTHPDYQAPGYNTWHAICVAIRRNTKEYA